MKLKKLHITLLLSLIWSFCFSQKYTNYSTKDGLPSNHVYTIVQDAKGFMWFLTDKGMVKYNGKTFKSFTTKDGLPNNDVWEAFTTPNGKVWYFSKSTRLGYIVNDSVISFSNKKTNEIINPTHSFQISDSVYPASPFKIYKLEDATWQSLKKSESGRTTSDYLGIFHKNVGYLGLSENVTKLNVFSKNDKLLKQYPSTKDIAGNGKMRGQITDSLFFWVSNTSYSILNLNSLKLKHFNFKDEIKIETTKYPRINLVDDQLQITGQGFVGILDSDFHITKPFYFPPEFDAHFGFIDRQKTVWLSTFNKGIYKLPYIKRNINYAFQGEKIQKITCINNQLYLGVYKKGFFKYNKVEKQFQPYINSDGYIYNINYIEPLKTLFFLSDANTKTEKNSIKKTISFQDSDNTYIVDHDLKNVTDYNSKIYGIGSSLLYKLDYNKLQIESEIIQKGVNDILVFKNRLLIATNNGLKEIINDSIRQINFSTKDFKAPILSIKPINNQELLINTDGYGSFISDLKSIKPLENSEFLIVQDAYIAKEDIWLATNTGVLHFDKSNNKYQLIKNYTTIDGLPNNNVNTLYVSDTELFAGTNNGLATLPINTKKQNGLVDLYFKSAYFNNNRIIRNNSVFDYTKNNLLSIESGTINYINDNENTFYYKLEPIQDQWIATNTNKVNFNNLSPNKYTYHLKKDGKEKQLAFSILPLWWQTIWAKIVGFLIAVALITLIVYRIIKRSQAKKNKTIIQQKKISEIQLKALRSQMNPHFVFNSLAAIQYYINNNEIEASETYLVKFSKLIRQFFELSKENEITLKEELQLITNYLDIEKLRFKERFQYKINVDEALNTSKVKLPTMLLQPIIENAVNHGVFNKVENGRIVINFIKKANNTVVIEIIDDGVGFANTKKSSSAKVKSSNVLNDRLKFLNQSQLWKVSYTEEELHPNKDDRGNKSIFIITKL